MLVGTLDTIDAILMYHADIAVGLPAIAITGLWYFFATLATPTGTLAVDALVIESPFAGYHHVQS